MTLACCQLKKKVCWFVWLTGRQNGPCHSGTDSHMDGGAAIEGGGQASGEGGGGGEHRWK